MPMWFNVKSKGEEGQTFVDGRRSIGWIFDILGFWLGIVVELGVWMTANLTWT